jgi:transcriptional activator of cad operon
MFFGGFLDDGIQPVAADSTKSTRYNQPASMQNQFQGILRIGDWQVNPATGEISRNGETIRLEMRTMRLLLCLAEHPGEVVSIEDLLNQIWSGVNVSPDSVYQAVASLRRQLGDDSKQPKYIETIPRLGYRMVAKVSSSAHSTANLPSAIDSSRSENPPPPSRNTASRRLSKRGFIGLILVFLAAGFFVLRTNISNRHPDSSALAAQPQKSVAVLPFLDLTERMKEGEFADGMTEELIDKISKIPGFRVPAPTSSFYFKDKQLPVADIAKALNVSYVLDGSVRKSGERLRIAARLVRAENGYVMWSETYDRPAGDILMVQDDIATAVAKALSASIDNGPSRQ